MFLKPEVINALGATNVLDLLNYQEGVRDIFFRNNLVGLSCAGVSYKNIEDLFSDKNIALLVEKKVKSILNEIRLDRREKRIFVVCMTLLFILSVFSFRLALNQK